MKPKSKFLSQDAMLRKYPNIIQGEYPYITYRRVRKTAAGFLNGQATWSETKKSVNEVVTGNWTVVTHGEMATHLARIVCANKEDINLLLLLYP